MTNSVWTFPYSKLYYLTHPWRWFRQLWQNCHDAYRRARYGWTYTDVWNWDDWFLRTAVPMLRYLADHNQAYPLYEEFDTPEKWQQWLRRMADLLESGDEYWQDAHNEYYKDYMDSFNINWRHPVQEKDSNVIITATSEELQRKYLARAKELSLAGEKNVIEAFNEIGKKFHAIWD
jgi:hypothetical protein